MRAIYTRKFGSGVQSIGSNAPMMGVPPGYCGSAFTDSGRNSEPAETPEEAQSAEMPIVEQKQEEADSDKMLQPTVSHENIVKPRSGREPILQLIEMLRGRIGTEELILTMVLLLVASDGIGAETVILVLALLAG